MGGTSAGTIYGIVMSHADFDSEKVEKAALDSVKSKRYCPTLFLPHDTTRAAFVGVLPAA